MDATAVESDVHLQKVSADLIVDFERSLGPLLRKHDAQGEGTQLRSRVRSRELSRLIVTLLEPFQELPQLLDPYLSKFIPTLSSAYLQYLSQHRGRRGHRLLSMRDGLLTPLSTAIACLLYTFCKIRGEKVVVRFLNVETKYLELVLSAVEDAEKIPALPYGQDRDKNGGAVAVPWQWQERYVTLLWLSHLLLAPFDLSTISSIDTEDLDVPVIRGLVWPKNLPGIVFRVIPLAIKYLSSPGKERDGAKALLVRIAMRKDMQELGVLRALVDWALSALRSHDSGDEGKGKEGGETRSEEPYYYIGVLSFLAGISHSSVDTSDMDPYLDSIFYTVHAISPESATAAEDPVHKVVASSAVARKTIIKVIRSIAVLVLRYREHDGDPNDDGKGGLSTAAIEGDAHKKGDTMVSEESSIEVTENTISYLLESLADNDTPVRFAASKALSIITLKLDLEMAGQVIEEVLDSLNKNVLWKPATTSHNPNNPDKNNGDEENKAETSTKMMVKDISNVDPLEWHGLMLTLSHLLYRRSPPPETLPSIVSALLTGLAFERRGMSGGSVGTNVRDASCFGIWAVARRYTTAELLAVNPSSLPATTTDAAASSAPASILQAMGTALVVTATLDPAGNIRRGASAALQELIGRHPDTVVHGIPVVQAVDYHAVALRSRASGAVAFRAAELDAVYGEALLQGLLGWRGIGDMDASARRVAGETYGKLTGLLVRTSTSGGLTLLERVHRAVDVVLNRLKGLHHREVEERHGLLVCLASVVDWLVPELHAGAFAADMHASSFPNPEEIYIPQLGTLALKLEAELSDVVATARNTVYRRPELVAEASSRLMVSSLPIFQALVFCDHCFLQHQQKQQPPQKQELRVAGGNGGDGTGMMTNLIPTTTTTAAYNSEPGSNIVLPQKLQKGSLQLSPGHADLFTRSLDTLDTLLHDNTDTNADKSIDLRSLPRSPDITTFKLAVSAWLSRPELEVVDQVSQAALVVLAFSTPKDRRKIIGVWAGVVRERPSNTALRQEGTGTGYLRALAAARRLFVAADTMAVPATTSVGTAAAGAGTDTAAGDRVAEGEGQGGGAGKISDAILVRWHADRHTDTRVAILRSLYGSEALGAEPLAFVGLLAEGMDDYTTTARGDVGSLVRLEALKATKMLWKVIVDGAGEDEKTMEWLKVVVGRLYLRVLRLAAEKLDRVRVEAQRVLALSLRDKPRLHFSRLTFSSQPYFRFLLRLHSRDWIHPELSHAAMTSTTASPQVQQDAASGEDEWMTHLLAGYVTSADTGSEDLVMCARAALVKFCDESPQNLNRVVAALVTNLRKYCSTPSSSAPTATGVTTATGGAVAGGATGGAIVKAAGVGKAASARTAKANARVSVGVGQKDRVVVPTLEIIGFLLKVGVFGRVDQHQGQVALDWKTLCALVQRAAYKSGSLRRIEACVRVYGGIGSLEGVSGSPTLIHGKPVAVTTAITGAAWGAGASPAAKKQPVEDSTPAIEDSTAAVEFSGIDATRKKEGIAEAKRRLGALLYHPWPRIRSLVVDELWGVFGLGLDLENVAEKVDLGVGEIKKSEAAGEDEDGKRGDGEGLEKVEKLLMGIDWGKARKEDVSRVVGELGVG